MTAVAWVLSPLLPFCSCATERQLGVFADLNLVLSLGQGSGDGGRGREGNFPLFLPSAWPWWDGGGEGAADWLPLSSLGRDLPQDRVGCAVCLSDVHAN